MPQSQRPAAPDERPAPSRAELPLPRTPRAAAADHARTDRADTGDATLAVQNITTPAEPPAPAPAREWTAAQHRRTRQRGRPWTSGPGSDLIALLVALLDVWLVIPHDAAPYQVAACGVSCSAMLLRRRLPFVALLITAPGFLFGWSELAPMIAMGTLAWKRGWVPITMVGATIMWGCRFIIWPWDDFLAESWREHVLDGIWGVVAIGTPVAIALLINARTELSARIAELAATREREHRLHAHAVRESERAKLAREMHDVVSHQVTLIAMQAGALQVSADSVESQQAANTIRALSTQTLDELRELVGLLRSGGFDEDSAQPGLGEVSHLVRTSDVKVTLRLDADPGRLPAPVSGAAYRTVQEALTNVRKHAAGAKASVWIRTDDHTLLVDVTNGRPRGRKSDLPSGGHGLVGLRERAGLLGGTFDAGATSDGGFELRARYPIATG